MMKCPTCGKKHYSSVTECLNCGFPLVQYQTLRDQRNNAKKSKTTNQQTPRQVSPNQNNYPYPQSYPFYYPTIPSVNPYQSVYTYYPPQQIIQQPMYAQPLVQQTPKPLPEELLAENEILPDENQGIGTKPENVIEKPTFGYCVLCSSDQLVFNDDGSGMCVNCGRTFNWLDIEAQRRSEEDINKSDEDNPFIVKPDEVLPLSERKAEIGPDDEFVPKMIPSSSVVESQNKNKSIDIDEKILIEINESTDNETRLKVLETKYLIGEVSSEVYSYLRKILIGQLVQELEDKFLDGKIDENKFKSQLKMLKNQ